MEKKACGCSTEKRFRPYLTGLGAWALAVGASIGWGSLVVTNNEYLAKAGPLGSILGLLIGAAIMFIMARNFFYMASSTPDAGGVYAYVKKEFGYDRAFLISWFLSLTWWWCPPAFRNTTPKTTTASTRCSSGRTN